MAYTIQVRHVVFPYVPIIELYERGQTIVQSNLNYNPTLSSPKELCWKKHSCICPCLWNQLAKLLKMKSWIGILYFHVDFRGKIKWICILYIFSIMPESILIISNKMSLGWLWNIPVWVNVDQLYIVLNLCTSTARPNRNISSHCQL